MMPKGKQVREDTLQNIIKMEFAQIINQNNNNYRSDMQEDI